jgi:CotH kinase protein
MVHVGSAAMRLVRSSRFGFSLATIGLFSIFLLAESRPASAEPPPGPAGWLYDPEAVVEIDLELPQESIEVLEVEPEEAYQPATFSLTTGGQTYGPLEVGARLKGGLGSFRPLSQKAAFKLKFDELVEDQTFLGLEKLTLNNMVQDPTMIHEALAYESFRALGLPASRTGYAWVNVNGEPYGLYLNIEVLDAISLPRWLASTRHLYEGSYGTDVTPGAAAAFEVDEGKKSKREDLEALIAAANAGGGDWSDGMAAVADLEQMTRMWAVERYIGHWDGYAGHGAHHLSPNNYYLHSADTGADAGIFRMLPWGTDRTWETRLGFGHKGGLLLDRCLADASCAAMYREALIQTAIALGGLDLDARAVALAETVGPWQGLELEPRREYTPSEAAAAVEATRGFIAERPAELADWLAGKPLPPAAPRAPAPAGAGQSGVPIVPVEGLRVGAPRFVDGEIVTPVELPSPGSVVQRVFMRIRGRTVKVCAGRESRSRPGALLVRCGPSATACRRLRRRRLALAIGIGFTPRGGEQSLVLRQLTVPKRSRAFPASVS